MPVTARHTQLAEHMRQMGPHGSAGDAQSDCDLGIGEPLGEGLDHSHLGWCEALPAHNDSQPRPATPRRLRDRIVQRPGGALTARRPASIGAQLSQHVAPVFAMSRCVDRTPPHSQVAARGVGSAEESGRFQPSPALAPGCAPLGCPTLSVPGMTPPTGLGSPHAMARGGQRPGKPMPAVGHVAARREEEGEAVDQSARPVPGPRRDSVGLVPKCLSADARRAGRAGRALNR